jgi:enamine deaminase RidA (YjgF/YER057c/UK114 family)
MWIRPSFASLQDEARGVGEEPFAVFLRPDLHCLAIPVRLDLPRLISSGSPYEPKAGISRAVRVGNIIAVSGIAPLGPDGRTVGIGDAGAQARRCLEIIAAALEKAGASLRHVVRTRTLLVRIEDWQAVAAVHGEFFGQIRPANTIMQVSRFIDPDWLVEFEADAVSDNEQYA